MVAALQTASPDVPEVVFGPYGSSPALAAAAAAPVGRVIWNHGGSNSALCWPPPSA